MPSVPYPYDVSSFIGGDWVGKAGRKVEAIINPSTEEVIGELAHCTEQDLDRALASTDQAWNKWRMQSADERGVILHKAADLLEPQTQTIATIIALEQGKPLTQAMREVGAGIALLRLHAEEAKRTYGRLLVRQPGKRATVSYEPVGPSAVFTPWNFPFFNIARKVAPALAAGCSVICKPAEETPAAATFLLKALVDAGLPAGACQMVFVDPAVISEHLIGSSVIRKVSFTGSVSVGKHLAQLAAGGMKRVTMELGGHAPVIIYDDADIDKHLDALVLAKFRNAGQVCVCPTRFYVQRGIYDSFVELFCVRTESLVSVGDPTREETVMGPLANARRVSAIADLTADAVDAGAQLCTGGSAVEGKGFFHQPTVLADVPAAARVMHEEPFGPIAPINPFDTLEDAVRMANQLPFGLGAYVFTQDIDRALLTADLIEAGMVGVNSTSLSSGDSPFGGIKESGYGLEDGPEGLAAFMVPKAIHIG